MGARLAKAGPAWDGSRVDPAQSTPLRRLAVWGARKGPRALLRYSPKPFGVLFALLLPELRRRVVNNLRRLHGGRRVVSEQFQAVATLANYAACFAEGLAFGREGTKPHVEVRGEHHLREALKRGGLVLVTAHVGPWDLAAQLLASVVHAEVMVVMEPEPNAEARAMQDRIRGEHVRVLHVGTQPTDALPLVAHLRSGGVAALQLDRSPPNSRTLRTDLLGTPFDVPEGPFRVAALGQVPVVPIFARRVGFFSAELQVSEPIWLPVRPSAAELQAAAQSAVESMAAFLRESPTQWFHFSKSEPARASLDQR